jgi:hypothetical protein
MIQHDSRVVAVSVSCYRLLLNLYPREHRKKYGHWMEQVFRDCVRDAYANEGRIGVMLYWLPVLLDMAKTVYEERQEKGFTMSKENFVQWHPAFMMLGGILLALAGYSQLQPDDHWQFYGWYSVSIMGLPVAIFALALSLYGIRQYYHNELNQFGKWILALAILGGILTPITVLLLPLGDAIWSILMIVLLLPLIGSILLGITILLSGFMSRWIGVFLIIGGAMPFVIPLLHEAPIMGPLYADFAVILIGGICFFVAGFGMQHIDERETRQVIN